MIVSRNEDMSDICRQGCKLEMTTKRKLDGLNSDCGFLFETMTWLSKKNPSDAKSLLLFMKTIAPNSNRVKMAEYTLLKDHCETGAAANLLGQMFTSQGESIQEELKSLFNGLRSFPPDKIFTKIGSSLQKDFINLYLEEHSTEESKSNEILRLLKHSEFRSHPSIIATLAVLGFKALTTCESTLVKNPKNLHVVCKGTTKAQDTAEYVDKSQQNRVRPSSTLEESEEGEVLGDDDDDDVVVESSACQLADSGNTFRFITDPALNVFRFKITTELLPLICKTNRPVKLDAGVLFELSLASLGFLVSYATASPHKRALLGATNNHDGLSKAPVEYFTQWILDISELLRWPHRITVHSELSSAEDSLCILSITELTAVLNLCLDKLAIRNLHNKPELSSKKKRHSHSRTGDIADASTTKTHLLPFQSLSLLWFITVKVGYDYLSRYRPDWPLGCDNICSSDQLSWFPISVTSLLSCALQGSEKRINSGYHPLLQLSQLWRLRKFNYKESCYSFGIDAVDSLNRTVCPTLSVFETECKETCMEQLLHFELFLSGMGMQTASELTWGLSVLENTDIDKEGDKLSCLLQLGSIYSHDKVIFLKWLGSIVIANRSAGETGKDSMRKRYVAFTDQFTTLFIPESSTRSVEAVQVTSDCWMLPFTRSSIYYIGVKTIAWWLYRESRIDFDHQSSSSSSTLDVICLVCVLSQIDSATEHFLTDYPCFNSSDYEKIMAAIEKQWDFARSRFFDWLKSPIKFIEDVGLLNRLAQIELAFQANTFDNTEQSDFLVACITCLQTPSVEPITVRLREFIKTESASIKSHLNNPELS